MSQSLTATNSQVEYQITNHADIPVVLVQASASDKDALNIQLYDQPLTMLQAGVSGNILKDGGNASVTIEHAQDGMAYSLIVAQADNLFPAMAFPVAFPENETSTIAVSVKAADRKAMQLAEKFLQTITAFPSSELATGYATALADKDINSTNRFFQNTKDYKELTLNKVVAVQTYYNSYPFIWANYASKKVYRLYQANASNTTDVGSLTIITPAQAPASVDKSHPDFSIVYQPAEAASEPVTLAYSNGKFSNKDGAAKPAVELKGVFSTADGTTKDQSALSIITLLKGTIDNVEVLGAVQEDEDSKPWISIDGLLHPEDLKDKLQLAGIATLLAGTLAILAAAAGGIAYALYRRKIRLKKGVVDVYDDTDTDSEYYADENGGDAFWEVEEERIQKERDDNFREWKDGKNLYTELGKKQQMQAMDKAIANQYEMLGKITQYENTSEVQAAMDAVDESSKQLDDIAGNKSKVSLQEFNSGLGSNMELLKVAYERMEGNLQKTEKTEFEKIQNETNDIIQVLQEREQAAKESEGSSETSPESRETIEISYLAVEK
ncbi:MAG: hypothetical protein INR73_15440 [Williamsia sp.]|nr:hypothetical protein [Williamsia sp.]